MSRLVLLLRGINVGKAKQVGMADLKALLQDGGYQAVRTHLRSGNVILQTRRGADAVARDVERRIAERFGFGVDIVVRTEAELAAVVHADPFADIQTDPSRQLVAFLSAVPDPDAVAALSDQDPGSDRFVVDGRDIHLWIPGGVADSALYKLMTPRKLNAIVTVRNWSTVTKLLEMVQADG